ncbi:MFS family permease [Saccharopolyspora phatthalungensis]|uniref:MFS family permease n=1 Tax=Saccharopolyspora phatthalungensis TaxID=664693 RepID=A0A840QFQ2_9PSEU|nr:MFS transporter [Saccharopolyspora phatthalungensis]MBB5159664.1 MFS family permease [Saccharopolyspora phatthalungensis]
MGVLPGYQTFGTLAPVLLVLLRFCQGLGLGGGWGGAVAMVAEHGEAAGGAGRRGFFTSWPEIGVPAGNLLAVGAPRGQQRSASRGCLQRLGLAPALLVQRRADPGKHLNPQDGQRITDVRAGREPGGQASAAAGGLPAPPSSTADQIGIRIGSDVSYYTFALFSITYVTQRLGLSKSLVLNGVMVASVVQLVAIPYFGALSDRVGRRPIYLAGAIGVAVWGFAFFPLLDTGSEILAITAVTVGLLFQAAMFGPMGAYISELFPTSVRYSGSSIGYQLAGVVGGSVAPLIGVALLTAFGSGQAVAYTAIAATITIVVVDETSRNSLANGPDETTTTPLAAPPNPSSR